MKPSTASIRELRTDFRLVKRKIELYGEVTITDNGEPAYILKPVPRPPASAPASMPDYYARVQRRQPRPMSRDESLRFWAEGRGER
jgi:hypothetical protein